MPCSWSQALHGKHGNIKANSNITKASLHNCFAKKKKGLKHWVCLLYLKPTEDLFKSFINCWWKSIEIKKHRQIPLFLGLPSSCDGINRLFHNIGLKIEPEILVKLEGGNWVLWPNIWMEAWGNGLATANVNLSS